MISTTLNTSSTNVDLFSATKVSVSAKRSGTGRDRNWTLLLVFVLSPLIMLGTAIAILVAAFS